MHSSVKLAEAADAVAAGDECLRDRITRGHFAAFVKANDAAAIAIRAFSCMQTSSQAN